MEAYTTTPESAEKLATILKQIFVSKERGRVFYLWGSGNNGKTTLFQEMRRLLSKEEQSKWMTFAEVSSLTARRFLDDGDTMICNEADDWDKISLEKWQKIRELRKNQNIVFVDNVPPPTLFADDMQVFQFEKTVSTSRDWENNMTLFFETLMQFIISF